MIQDRLCNIMNGIALFAKDEGPFKRHPPVPSSRKTQDLLQKYREDEESGGKLESLSIDDLSFGKYHLSEY